MPVAAGGCMGVPLARTERPWGSAEDVWGVEADHPECHCASVVSLPGAGGERLVAAWYAGSAECRPDVAVFVATRDGAGAWSPATVVVDTPGQPDGNPVLGVSPGGRLWLIFATLDGPRWDSCRLRRMHSADGGRTWSPPEPLPGAEPGWLVRNKPIAQGRAWLLPVYDEVAWNGFVLRSSDDGESWSAGGRIVAETGCIQPTLLPEAGPDPDPEGLAALLRCGRRGGPLWISRSVDGGRHWSGVAPTPLHNPNSGCDAVARPDGTWLLACNDGPDRRVLALRLSRDGGRTWPGRWILAEGEREYSYPALIPAADGGLHLLYTHERRSIRHLHLAPGWPA